MTGYGLNDLIKQMDQIARNEAAIIYTKAGNRDVRPFLSPDAPKSVLSRNLFRWSQTLQQKNKLIGQLFENTFNAGYGDQPDPNLGKQNTLGYPTYKDEYGQWYKEMLINMAKTMCESKPS